MKNWIKAIIITAIIIIVIAVLMAFEVLPYLFLCSLVLMGTVACVCLIKDILDECDRGRRKRR